VAGEGHEHLVEGGFLDGERLDADPRLAQGDEDVDRLVTAVERTASRRDSGVPWATLTPRSITAIRSASWSASSRYCVVSRTVQPSVTSSRMVSHIWPRVRGSSPVVGSSRKISGGRLMRLAARSSRRRMSPENALIGLVAASVSSNCSSR
jgi:hypothetical protein